MTEKERLIHSLNENGIPGYMHDGVLQYVLNHRACGDFFMAVVSNDLKEACGRADHNNQFLLFDYVRFLYNSVPSGCWGSKEKVTKWLATKVEVME